jgi:hypothetical protein
MTIGGSIFLIAAGAILYFATNLHVAHISIDTVGFPTNRAHPLRSPA